uniref:Syntaxin 6/10/61 N-terminal domain-containing protein n=1 Tax=Kalanchoe fedtschenkoi TaxID=63787 RepID=A0A7N0UUL2_KALFE
MSSAQDPFYIVKEEIQESIDKLQSNFHRWEVIPPDSGGQLTKDLIATCDSIEWQVDELDKAIAVAARDPSWYGIDQPELDRRRRWTNTARSQVAAVKKALASGKEPYNTSNASGMRRELMRLPEPQHPDRSNQYADHGNDDFISSESDRQLLLIKQQDEELDELSASVERIGGVGLTIHEELLAQVKRL